MTDAGGGGAKTLGSEQFLRRLAVITGTIMLVSVGVETFMAFIDNGVSMAGNRFLSFTSIIPRLGHIVWGLALLVAGWWTTEDQRLQRRAGLVLVGCAVLALLPLIELLRDIGTAASDLGPVGKLRAHTQFLRGFVFFLTLSGLLVGAGRLVLARSRQGGEPELAASSS